MGDLINHWRATRKQRRVAAQKRVQSARGSQYCDSPQVTFVLQFFNKRENIDRIAERLLPIAEELIVIDDGSIDGSFTKWMNILYRPNHFLLRTNDLYEVRTYDRAMRMARGEFVCFLQDDYIHPDDAEDWLNRAVGIFERLSDLPVLGFDVGGVRDILQDGLCGCLVPRGDVTGLTEMIVHMLRDQDLLHEMKHRCREREETEYGVEVQASAMPGCAMT